MSYLQTRFDKMFIRNISAEAVLAPVPALTVMPRRSQPNPALPHRVASAKRGDGKSPRDRGERGADKSCVSQPVAATRDARGGRGVAKPDVAELRAQYNQQFGVEPACSASASQPDQLTPRPQVQIGFCTYTFAISQSELKGKKAPDMLYKLGELVAQTVQDHHLDVFVACGIGGSQQGLEDAGKQYKDILAPFLGSDVEAEARLSSTAAWNLGGASFKLCKIFQEVRELSVCGAGSPMLAMWAFKVSDMTFENYGFLCIASLSVNHNDQVPGLTKVKTSVLSAAMGELEYFATDSTMRADETTLILTGDFGLTLQECSATVQKFNVTNTWRDWQMKATIHELNNIRETPSVREGRGYPLGT